MYILKFQIVRQRILPMSIDLLIAYPEIIQVHQSLRTDTLNLRLFLTVVHFFLSRVIYI